jgi:hypothetical protein
MDQEVINPHNACIVSFFMDNLDIKTVQKHAETVAKFNKSKVPHYHINTPMNHGASMDYIWHMMGLKHKTFGEQAIEKKFDHDIVFFLDVDALPLHDWVIDHFIDRAANGVLIGNIQRSNHIQNDQHVFAAPSAVALSVDTFLTLEKPSAMPNHRSDVGEEYTWAAEKVGVPFTLLMPLKFDAPPAECPSWALKDGMPVYGRGTTFGYFDTPDEVFEHTRDHDLIWHNFQSFHPGQQERFLAKCEELLNVKE